MALAWWWISVPNLRSSSPGPPLITSTGTCSANEPAPRIHHVVAAGAVGHAGDAQRAGGARVAVGCEADRGLVRERDDLPAPALSELREQAQHQVARDAEEIFTPMRRR